MKKLFSANGRVPWLNQNFKKVKLTILFLITAMVGVYATESYAQNTKLTLKADDISIENLLTEIEGQTEFRFFYNENVRLDKVVSVTFRQQNVTQVLDEVLTGSSIGYKIIDRLVALYVKDHGDFSFLSNQELLIKGIITDTEGVPLPGVNVVEKGTSNGTVTNLDGEYSINVSSPNAILSFSYIGYLTEDVEVASQTLINVTLVEDILSLDEVVVVGYGTQKRSDLTGAIASMDASSIEKLRATNVAQALQGNVAGVQITSDDGAPGAGASVMIRGIGSFGNNSPLYVVDGYPISGGLSSINPNDIESIDVLKDASSAAIYGNRASNGVVIITTKRGNSKGLEVSFDAVTSVQSLPKMYDVLDAQTFAQFATEIADQEAYPVLDEWRNPSSLRNIDWQKEVYRQGLKKDYNLSIRGGNEKIQSSFSMGYLDHDGIVLASDYRRVNGALTLDYMPKKWFKSATNINYAYSDGTTLLGSGNSNKGIGGLVKLIPTMTGNPETDMVKDENGNYGYYTKEADAVTDNENLVTILETRDKVNQNNDLRATSYIELIPIDGLVFKSNFGINVRDYSGYSFVPYDDRVYPEEEATYSQSSNNTYEWLWENTVTFNKDFGAHAINLLAGISAQENTYRTMTARGEGLASDYLRSVGALELVSSVSGYQQKWSLASQFARATYKLLDRYIVTGTVRRDGSSRFAEGNKYGIFPSVSASWKVSEEEFLSGVEFISSLKLRASYGEAGNQSIGLFQYESTYTPGTSRSNNRGYVFGDSKTYVDGLALSFLPNPDLKWETSKQTDFGIDASFLNNKLTFTGDYYERISSDFLLNIQVPSQTGFSSATRNVGSIKNSGFEFALGYRNAEHEFKYGINVNLTTVNNEILEFMDGMDAVSNFSTLGFPNYGAYSWQVFSQSEVGGSVGAFYGFKTDGIIQTQDEIDALNAAAQAENGEDVYYIASGTAPGDRKFVDMDGDKRITDDDRVIIGSPLPDFYGGVNMDGAYKNFDLNLFFSYSYGNDIFNFAKRNLMSLATIGGLGVENVSTDFYENRWTEDNPSDDYPRAVRTDVSGNSRPSDFYIEDGSYIKLKNIMLGYTLPETLSNKLLLSKVRIYVSAQNLLTFTKYSGLDPEIGEAGDGGVTAFGIDIGNYPSSKFYTVGLNIGF